MPAADFYFMAVYGGRTEGEAQELLTKARRRFPGANLRRLKVVLDFADA